MQFINTLKLLLTLSLCIGTCQQSQSGAGFQSCCLTLLNLDLPFFIRHLQCKSGKKRCTINLQTLSAEHCKFEIPW